MTEPSWPLWLCFAFSQIFRPHGPLLIESLWPDQDPDVTGNRLRVLLHRVRALFEPLGVERGTVLQSHRHVVALNPAGFSCDAADFLAASANALRRVAPEPAAQRFENLERAAQLYAGELLPGFYHDWILAERTRLASLHFQILCRLTHDAAAMGQPERGLPYARQATSYEPLEETAQFGLIQTLGLMGQTFEALRQYEQYRSARFAGNGGRPVRPFAEFGSHASPAAERVWLPSAIVAPDDYSARNEAPPSDLPPPPPRPVPELPKEAAPRTAAALPPRLTRFFGRDEEMTALRLLLAPHAPTRLVTLLGPGGVGKTRLSIETAQQLQADYAGRVFFAALADVTSAAHLPDALLHALRLSPSRTEDALFQALLALGAAPALLIIDNLEHLLPGAKAMITQIVSETPSLALFGDLTEQCGHGRGTRFTRLRPCPFP